MNKDVPHIPVLLAEVLDALDPEDGKHFIDGTFGAGGYSSALIDRGARVTGFDQDPNVIANAQNMLEVRGERLNLIEAPFSSMGAYFEPHSVDGVVLDIGVSSMQLDQAERGFSFQQDGPLDMRMAQEGLSAADVVNTFAVNDLIRIIGILGEEKQASRIAKSIVDIRDDHPFETTVQLAKHIEKVMPRKSGDKIHPATRTFQGLRIFVNDELNELVRALYVAENILKIGGKLAVVTFHSLEDRIVKRYFQDCTGGASGSRFLPASEPDPVLYKIKGKAMTMPGEAEISSNPRARSAKLRYGMRTSANRETQNFSIFKLPNLPWPRHVHQISDSMARRRY